MFIKLKSLLLSLIVFAGTLLISEAANLADYTPLSLGSYWTYQNAADSNDTYTVSIFEKFVFSGFNGQPAVKFGTDSNNYSISYNNGTSVNIYAGTENGITSGISIGNFTDGTFFNLIEPTNFVLLRMYDNLNPTLKSVYDINEPHHTYFIAQHGSRQGWPSPLRYCRQACGRDAARRQRESNGFPPPLPNYLRTSCARVTEPRHTR
jgi:hypothetical protein